MVYFCLQSLAFPAYADSLAISQLEVEYLSTQSLSDIAQRGGVALVCQILSKCNNFIIQPQNYHQDAEQLVNIIGTLDRFQLRSQFDGRIGSTGVGSVRQTKEFIAQNFSKST